MCMCMCVRVCVWLVSIALTLICVMDLSKLALCKVLIHSHLKQLYICRVQKSEANQKQQLSDHSYIGIHATENFDIS